MLANVYLHYTLDLWYEKVLRKRCKGEVYYVRHADDFLLMFQYENEAHEVMAALKARLGKFGLELAEDKTRILPIGRFKGTKETFDILGFTFFNTTTRGGKYRLGVRTSQKKLKAKKLAVKTWLKERMHKSVPETMKLIQLSLTGHCNYYGVSGNFHMVQNFYRYVKYMCFRVLNRRHQKRSMKHEKFSIIWDYYVQEPRLTKDIWNWQPKLV